MRGGGGWKGGGLGGVVGVGGGGGGGAVAAPPPRNSAFLFDFEWFLLYSLGLLRGVGAKAFLGARDAVAIATTDTASLTQPLFSVQALPAALGQAPKALTNPARLPAATNVAASAVPSQPAQPPDAAETGLAGAAVPPFATTMVAPAPLLEQCQKCQSKTTSKTYKTGPRAGKMCWLKGLCNKCHQAKGPK